MAKYDHGGGCACGLNKVCICSESETVKQSTKPENTDGYYVLVNAKETRLQRKDEAIRMLINASPDERWVVYKLGRQVNLKMDFE